MPATAIKRIQYSFQMATEVKGFEACLSHHYVTEQIHLPHLFWHLGEQFSKPCQKEYE